MTVALAAPRLMLVGGGSVARLAEVLGKVGITRPLVVTDPWLVSSGTVEKCLAPLREAGMAFSVFSDTVPDPTDTVIEAGVAAFRAAPHDGLVGFGGGSPMDTAKAIAILAVNGGHIRERKVPHQADRAAAPVVCVPTTAGTGSEVTRFTVITDTAHNEKMLISGLGALPVAAIVDHELTYTVPPRTTADTGIDSLTHALEAYVSRRANPTSDALALSAMALIGRHLRKAFHEPRNEAARAGMMLGAMQAGLAFSNASVALVHGMSRPIGAHFHVPHGLSNAMLLPAVTRFSIAAAPARYAAAARAVGIAKPGQADDAACGLLIAELRALNRELGVPSPAGFGIAGDAWLRLRPTMAAQALASGSPANNPRVPSAAEIEALYDEVWAERAN